MNRRGRTLLVAGALALAACSSDGSTTGGDTTAAAPTDAPTSAPATSAPETTGGETTAPPTSSTAPASTVPLATGDVTFTKLVEGLTKPVDIAMRAGDPAVYVAQQDGRIVRIVDGAVAGVVLDISSQLSGGPEQGLLGLAFHPEQSLAYVDFTNTDGDTVVAEFVVADDGTFDASTQRQVYFADQPYHNHNGGEVVFGPDGLLYIGFGDGGSAGDPERRALDLSSPMGKILRIDPLASGDRPYTVPADNPFVDTPGALPEIWSYGLRNPWRFEFDRETGDLWIADVGQKLWEEVNVAPAADGAGRGASFGWSAMEGNHPYNADQDAAGAIAPIWEYPHGDDGCSVSGGAVYRGSAIPSLVGAYVVADHCSSKVWALQPSADLTTVNVVPLGTVPYPSAVSLGPDGELWVLAHSDGAIYVVAPA